MKLTNFYNTKDLIHRSFFNVIIIIVCIFVTKDILAKMKKDIKSFLKQVNWKLLIGITLLTIIPTIYRTIRIFIIGEINDDGSSYSIASQIQWLNILYEIITEALIVPIFFIVAKLKNKYKDANNLSSTLGILFSIICSIFFIFTILIFATIKEILLSLHVNNDIIEKSITYIRFETISIFFVSISSFLIVIVSILRTKRFYTFLFSLNIVYLVVSIILDLFIMSNYSFSLKLNFIGAGISSLVSGVAYFLISLIYVLVNKTIIIRKNKILISKQDIILYFKNFIIAGLETGIRNIVFTYMIIGMMANIGSQGVYWQANSFIWSWLLIPINIISLFIKETNSSVKYFNDTKKDFLYKISFYYIMITIVILLWLFFLPLNPMFMKNVLNYDNYLEINKIVNLLFGFYICFALSSVIDAFLISEGRIGLFLLQTIIVNGTVYPIYFILYKLNVWIPDVNSIAIMFGIGLVVHLIVIGILFIIMVKLDDPFHKLKLYFLNIKKSNTFIKKQNSNLQTKEVVEYLKNCNFKNIPTYSFINKDYYQYKFINLFSYHKCYELQKYQIKAMFKLLRKFHNQTKELYIKNNHPINKDDYLYIHNDISQFNILFNIFGYPKYLIDLDDCKIGSKYIDIWHLLSTSINLGNWENESIKRKISLIKLALNSYGINNNEYKLLLSEFNNFKTDRYQYYLNRKDINLIKKEKWLNDIERFLVVNKQLIYNLVF